MGDFWGVEKVCSEMYNEKGTSLILINSEKGKKIFGLKSVIKKEKGGVIKFFFLKKKKKTK